MKKTIKKVLKKIAMFLFKEHIEESVKESIRNHGYDILMSLNDKNFKLFSSQITDATFELAKLKTNLDDLNNRSKNIKNEFNGYLKLTKDNVDIQMSFILEDHKKCIIKK